MIRAFYEQNHQAGLEFYNLDTLFGAVLSTAAPVLSNDPAHDPRRGGLAPEHPAMRAFMGLPFFRGDAMIGMVGLANRPGDYHEPILEALAPILATCSSMVHAHRLENQRQRSEQERHELEIHLHQSQKMEALGQLASGIAHDFNNLLMVVRNCAEFLNEKGDLDGPDPQEALGLIQGAVAQASDVTRSLLAFAGKGTSTQSVVDLNSIVADLGGLLRHLLPATIEIVVHLPESPSWILGDESQLQQILMNLAINSRDAMPDGGMISITVDEADGTARMTVKDTGVGISAELQSRVFEPFFSTKPRAEATGLGLAIVHGIVKDHGGEIRVQTRPDNGTTITISLPCVQEPTSGAVSIPCAIPKGQGQLVVLAEDGQQVRRVTAMLLRALGYEVELAKDGTEAIAKFTKQREQVELLILDLDMPNKTGDQCLRELRADGVETPVLLISAGHGSRRVTDALDEHTRILQKPFNESDLGSAIAELLSELSRTE